MKHKKLSTKKIRHFLLRHRVEVLVFSLIVLLAAFLRLYKIREFVVFLGDEGRDALVVKHILYDGKLTLLGPTASVGGFYLGPIYYYFMIPFMLAFGMDPVGPAVMIATIGIATVALLFFVAQKWFGTFSAAIASLLYAVSPGVVTFSRSSWNPNPMPFFSLLSISSLYFGTTTSRLWSILLSGICYGIAIQLHYLGLILGPILVTITLALTPPKKYFKSLLFGIIGFFIGASMYFAFELRHGFPNIRSVFEFVTRFGSTTGPRSSNLASLFTEINRFSLESVLSKNLVHLTQPLNYLLLFSIVLFLFYHLVTKKKLSRPSLAVIIFWLLGIVGFSLYKGQLHYHYFQLLFPAPFLLLALLLSPLRSTLTQIFVSGVTLASVFFLLTQEPIWTTGSNLIDQTSWVADEIIQLSAGKPYNFALITDGNSDHAYRFFLELKQATPITLESEITSQLIAVCEKEPKDCYPLGHPIWEIAGFGRAEIDQQVILLPNLVLYRLVHHPDSVDLIGTTAQKS